MTTDTVITLIIALYGALLSTVLAIREMKKEKRRMAIFLEHKVWSDTYSIIVTNIGHRPITLIDVSMILPDPYGPVPRYILREIEDPFPVTLEDGQNLKIRLPQHFGGKIDILNMTFRKNIRIYVYDAESKVYSDLKIISHNEKYGNYEANKK